MKDLAHKTGIETNGLLTNHSGRKTFAQLMQDADVDEQIQPFAAGKLITQL